MPGDLQKEMLGIFQNLKSRQLEAAAGAVFVTLARQASSQGLKPKMTLHQVSSIIDVSIHKIALAMKLLKKQEIVNQMGNGAITDPPDVIRAVLPDFPLRDPISGSDIKNKVTTLAGKIIQLIQRRSSQSLDPNCLTLAASHLAFQSCCYQQASSFRSLKLSLRRCCSFWRPFEGDSKRSRCPHFLGQTRLDNPAGNLPQGGQVHGQQIPGPLGLQQLPPHPPGAQETVGEDALDPSEGKDIPPFARRSARGGNLAASRAHLRPLIRGSRSETA